jgi:hypothetical protein
MRFLETEFLEDLINVRLLGEINLSSITDDVDT